MVVTDYNEQFLDKRGTDHLIDELKAYIDGIVNGNIDLSNYVTKEELQAELDALGVKIDLSSYATKEELTNAINSIVSSYALKTEIPNKVSELENDSGYLTEHQNLSAYAKKTDLHSHENKNVLDDISATDVSNWNDAKVHSSQPHAPSTAQPNFIEDIKVNGASLMISDKTVNIDLSKYAKKTEIPSLNGYATTKYVDDAIANIPTGDDVDLSNYYTKEETNALIPSTEGLATKEYVDNSISNIPTTDLTGYATKEYVSTAINSIPATDLSNYYTKEETDALIPSLNGYVTDTELEAKGYLTEHQDLSNYATKDEIPDVSGYITEIPEEYVTETELSAKGYLTEHQDISGKVDKVEGKSLISDTEIARLASVDNYDDTDIRAELANKADITAIPTVDVTKSYVDTELAKKSDTDHTHTTVNGHTVKSDVPENAVFTDTIYDGIIAELNANLNREIGRATEADEILKSRVDNITSLSEGSTTGDAELQDIRVKVDGTTATSAGNAVREQISKLKSDVNAKVPSILLKGGFQVVAYSEREISGNSKLECLENWITNALSKYISNLVVIGNIYNINYVDGFAIVNVWGDNTKGILGASGILVDQEGIHYYRKLNGIPGSNTLTKIN